MKIKKKRELKKVNDGDGVKQQRNLKADKYLVVLYFPDSSLNISQLPAV